MRPEELRLSLPLPEDEQHIIILYEYVCDSCTLHYFTRPQEALRRGKKSTFCPYCQHERVIDPLYADFKVVALVKQVVMSTLTRSRPPQDERKNLTGSALRSWYARRPT